MKTIDKDVEREEERVSVKGSKIGLAIIAILVMILIGLLVMKLSSTEDNAVASDSKQKPKAGRLKFESDNAKLGWSKSKKHSSSFDEPTVVSPAPKKTHYHGTKRANRWSLDSGNTSPNLSMMPNTTTGSSSAGSSSAGDVAVAPAPLPSTDQYRPWQQPSPSVGQYQQTTIPPDTFTKQPNQNGNTQAYPNYGTTQNQQYSSGPPYPAYPSNQPAANAPASMPEANPLRGNNGYDQQATRPSYDTGSHGAYDYPRDRHKSNTHRWGHKSDYEQAPHSRKMARPYSYPDDSSSSSSSSSYHYKLKSYHNDPYGSQNVSNTGLGKLRDDGKYVVGPNDSFSSISEKLYGTDAFFQALAEFNRAQYPDENRLQVGDVIVAPDESELMNTYPDLCPSPERRKVIRSRVQAVSTSSGYRTGPTYTVQQGDTLFDIARYKLGNGSRWPEIYELNTDVLQGDFNYVTPGIVLALPEDGSSDAVTQRPASRRIR